MGMTLTVYNISDDPRKLTKTLGSAVGTYTVNPTDNCDILNPVVSIHSTGTGAFPLTANYATLSDTGRQYFIKDITLGTGGKVYVHLAVDVLGTYDSQIRGCDCTITRAQWTGRTMIPDDQFPLNTNRRLIRNATFEGAISRPFSAGDSSIIIQTIGGDRTPINNNKSE